MDFVLLVDGWVQNGRRTLQSPSPNTQQVDIMALQEKVSRSINMILCKIMIVLNAHFLYHIHMFVVINVF